MKREVFRKILRSLNRKRLFNVNDVMERGAVSRPTATRFIQILMRYGYARPEYIPKKRTKDYRLLNMADIWVNKKLAKVLT